MTVARSPKFAVLGLLLAAGCGAKDAKIEAPAPTAAATETPAAETEPTESTDAAAVEAKLVAEKVTVKNPTKFAIMVELSAAAPDQDDSATVSFGPIEPDGQGSGTIDVWTNGSFSVLAKWEAGGEARESRPYTAVLDPASPLTPVTCTLNIPYESGSSGLWSGVEWEMPPGME